MQPIGADHQVEATRARTLKRYVYSPPVVLCQGRDGIAEDEFGAVPACLVKNRREITARQLNVLRSNRSSQPLQIDARRLPSCLIKKGHSGNASAGISQSRYNVHSFCNLCCGSANVDRTPAGTKSAAAFNNSCRMTVPGQPVGKRTTGNPRSGDQHVQPAHSKLLTYDRLAA